MPDPRAHFLVEIPGAGRPRPDVSRPNAPRPSQGSGLGRAPGPDYYDPTFGLLSTTTDYVIRRPGAFIAYLGRITTAGLFVDANTTGPLIVGFDSPPTWPLAPGMSYQRAFKEARIRAALVGTASDRALIAVADAPLTNIMPRQGTTGIPFVIPWDSAGNILGRAAGSPLFSRIVDGDGATLADVLAAMTDGNGLVTGSEVRRLGRTASAAPSTLVIPGAAGTETDLVNLALVEGRPTLYLAADYPAPGAGQSYTFRMYVTVPGGTSRLWTANLTVAAAGTAGIARYIQRLPALSTVRITAQIAGGAPDQSFRVMMDSYPVLDTADIALSGQ